MSLAEDYEREAALLRQGTQFSASEDRMGIVQDNVMELVIPWCVVVEDLDATDVVGAQNATNGLVDLPVGDLTLFRLMFADISVSMLSEIVDEVVRSTLR